MAAAWNSIILKKQFERLNPLLWTSCPLVWALPLITCDWSLARPQMAWSSWLIQISLSPGLYTKEVMFFVYVLWWKNRLSARYTNQQDDRHSLESCLFCVTCETDVDTVPQVSIIEQCSIIETWCVTISPPPPHQAHEDGSYPPCGSSMHCQASKNHI